MLDTNSIVESYPVDEPYDHDWYNGLTGDRIPHFECLDRARTEEGDDSVQ